MKTSAIIAAGGSGLRMKSKENKLFLQIGKIPILTRTISVFEKTSLIDEIVLVVPGNEIQRVEILVKSNDFKKIKSIVEGGLQRQDSVYNGLKFLSSDSKLVAIHDGARPFLSIDILERVINKAKECGAAIVAVKAKDTIKLVDTNFSITETLDRNLLWHAQTPQVFDTKLIKQVYEWAKKNNIEATDDASLVEKFGASVYVVEGSYDNLKITTKEDILIGEAILSSQK